MRLTFGLGGLGHGWVCLGDCPPVAQLWDSSVTMDNGHSEDNHLSNLSKSKKIWWMMWPHLGTGDGE